MSDDRNDIFVDGSVTTDGSGNWTSEYFSSEGVQQVLIFSVSGIAVVHFSAGSSGPELGPFDPDPNAPIPVPSRWFYAAISGATPDTAYQVSLRKYS